MNYIALGLIFGWILFSVYCGVVYSRNQNGYGKKFFYGLGVVALVLLSAVIYWMLLLVLWMAYFFGSWNIIHEFIGLIGTLSILVIAFVLPINLFNICTLKYKKIIKIVLNYSLITGVVSFILAYIGMILFGFSL